VTRFIRTKLEAKHMPLVMKNLQKLPKIAMRCVTKWYSLKCLEKDSFQVLYTNINDAMKSVLSLRLYLQSGLNANQVQIRPIIWHCDVEQTSENA